MLPGAYKLLSCGLAVRATTTLLEATVRDKTLEYLLLGVLVTLVNMLLMPVVKSAELTWLYRQMLDLQVVLFFGGLAYVGLTAFKDTLTRTAAARHRLYFCYGTFAATVIVFLIRFRSAS